MKEAALLAVVAMSSQAVHALTPEEIVSARADGTLEEIYFTGSPSAHGYLALWFQNQCTTSSFDVYFSGNGGMAPAGINYRAYACNLKRKIGNWEAGTSILLVKKYNNVLPSEGSVRKMARPMATQTAELTMAVDGDCVATGQPRPATSVLVPTYGCSKVQQRIQDANFSELEPTSLTRRPINVESPTLPLSGAELDNLSVGNIYDVIYGVAVNKKAYRALQLTQGLVQNDDAANQPSIPRAWVAGALLGTVRGYSSDGLPGWSPLIAPQFGSYPKTVNVCRRDIGSSTQTVSNAFFLNAGCTPAPRVLYTIPAGQLTRGESSTPQPTPISTVGFSSYVLNSSDADVELCLGGTSPTDSVEGLPGDAYGVGVLPTTRSPLPIGDVPAYDRGYRFVKLDGIAPTRQNAQAGIYSFVYSASMQWNKTVLTDANKIAFLTQVRNQMGRASTLERMSEEVQNGVMAPPSTYSGPYESIADASEGKFATSISRFPSSICPEPQVVK